MVLVLVSRQRSWLRFSRPWP